MSRTHFDPLLGLPTSSANCSPPLHDRNLWASIIALGKLGDSSRVADDAASLHTPTMTIKNAALLALVGTIGEVRLWGVGRDFAGLRDHDPQVARIGVPGSGDPAGHSALHAAATQLAIFRGRGTGVDLKCHPAAASG
jgi:hypothetical protein